MFGYSYGQNVHFQSQNRSFKECALFWQKIPATKRPFTGGRGGVEKLFVRMPFEHAVCLCGASLSFSCFPCFWGFQLTAPDLTCLKH